MAFALATASFVLPTVRTFAVVVATAAMDTNTNNNPNNYNVPLLLTTDHDKEEDVHFTDEEDDEEEDVIVVATIQGEVMGISRKTGLVLWKHSSSESSSNNNNGNNNNWSKDEWNRLFSPLVSTSSTAKPKLPSNTVAVPSVMDGRVYLTTPSTQEDGVSMRSILKNVPFLQDGRFYVGNRVSTAAAIDQTTGELLRVIHGEEGSSSSSSSSSLKLSLEGRKVVWIGRVDHSVTIYNARTGNVDVTFSSSEILSLSDMIGNYMLSSSEENDEEGNSLDEIFPPIHDAFYSTPLRTSATATATTVRTTTTNTVSSTHHSSTKSATTRLHQQDEDQNPQDNTTPIFLLSTPGGKLAMLHDTGRLVIANNGRSFSSAIVFAVSAKTGASLKVDIVPDAPIATDSVSYLLERFEKQLLLEQQQHYEEGSIIVGALPTSQQLFALPLGRRRSTSTTTTRSGTSVLTSSNRASSSSTSSSIRSSIPNKHLMHETSNLKIGVSQHTTMHSHYATSTAGSSGKALSAKKCTPASLTYPACLIGFRKNLLPWQPSPDNSFLEEMGEYSNNNNNNNNLVEILIGGQTYRFTFQTFFRITTSWIPLFLSMVVYIIFQWLDRKKRLDNRNMTTNNVPRLTKSESSTAATTTYSSSDVILITETNNTGTKSSRFDGTSNHDDVEEGLTDGRPNHPNVIRVSNEILGYGGHGTVVYKGTLDDGRKVAAKRMLKAYNASADREISLLIESDGHPNVVRYFLKEVRGDFVYLALELCDMSLADLIYSIESASSAQRSSTLWYPCIKIALYQIATGVRHLHSLRIVHRDLKPQNILLALRNRNDKDIKEGQMNRLGRLADEEAWKALVYKAFETNQLVPKISDMGLGKQLTGQSSFGVASIIQPSALNTENASLVGPGSVGWMAPEVMALRSRDPPSSFYDQASSSEVPPVNDSSLPSCNKRTSRSVDIFSLGCIFYCTLLPGLHPFGEWYEREANIMKGKPNTRPLEKISAEAYSLINSMLSRDPRARPTAEEICSHPFFWKPSKRLSFLSDFSDRVELQADNLEMNLLVVRVETNAAGVIGLAWDKALDSDFISNVSRFRTYDPSSVRDCLRMIRNKYHHFSELPDSVKDKIGSSLDDLLHYFEGKFPLLLMHCYNLCRDILPQNDPLVVKYGICCRAFVLESLVNQRTKLINGGSEVTSEVEHNSAPATPEMKSADSLDEGPPCADEVEIVDIMPIPETYETTDAFGEGEAASLEKLPFSSCSEENGSFPTLESPEQVSHDAIPLDVVIWEGSSTAKVLNCRGWMRSEEDWRRRTDALLRKRDVNITRCAEDPKFRTRLCNHWDESKGTFCSMRKKNKCIFAHGPVELRVKEGKRCRWGTLVDESGNNNNPFHSGGEDTYGTARSIESMRKEDGQWITDKARTPKAGVKSKRKPKEKAKNNL